MTIHKWQSDFQPRPEDRHKVEKSPLIDRLFLKKYLKYSASAIIVLSIAWYLFVPSDFQSDNDLPVVEAPVAPYKTKPINQDMNQESTHNKTIYEKLSAKKPDEKVEHLLQEPEEPVAPPPTLSAEFVGNLMNDEQASDTSAQKLEVTPSKTSPAATASLSETASSQIVEDQNQRQEALKTFFHENELDENSLTHLKEVSSEENVEKPMAVTVTGPSVKPQESVNTSPVANDQMLTHWIQLASVKTKEAAEREWKRLNSLAKLKPLLMKYKPRYGSVDMGEGEGIHYRLRIGLLPFKEAKTLCAKLRDLKVDCMVKKNQ